MSNYDETDVSFLSCYSTDTSRNKRKHDGDTSLSSTSKRRRIEEDCERSAVSLQYLISVLKKQIETKSETNQQFLDQFNQLVARCDSNITSDTLNFMSYMLSIVNDRHERIKDFKEFYAAFKKKCEEQEIKDKRELERLLKEIEKDIDISAKVKSIFKKRPISNRRYSAD